MEYSSPPLNKEPATVPNPSRFNVGDIILHNKFNYRGVIFEVDQEFSGSDQWYNHIARSRPPKDKPWYHVLVDGAEHTTYVAERHLHLAKDTTHVAHPLIPQFFDRYEDGRYERVYH